MKTHYVYDSKNLRCRVKYIRYMDHFELQMQVKRRFLGFVSSGQWMTVDEDNNKYDGYDWLGNPRTSSYEGGNKSETWHYGTLDLNKRVIQFINDFKSSKYNALVREQMADNLIKRLPNETISNIQY